MKIVNKRLFALSVGKVIFIFYALTTTLNMLNAVHNALNANLDATLLIEAILFKSSLWMGHLVVTSICFYIFHIILNSSKKKQVPLQE